MGVAKSLRKADYLKQAGDGVNNLVNYFDKKKKEKEKQDFINNVIGLYDNWQAGQTAAEQKDTVMQEGKTVNNVFSPENLSTNQQRNIMGADKKPEMGLKVNVPENVNDNMGMIPAIPETKTRQTSPEEQYSKARTNLGEFEKKLAPMIMNPNLDDNSLSRVNVLSNIARNQTEKLKPNESEFFDLSQGEKRYRRNPTTGKVEEVASNPKLDTDKSKKDFKVSEDGFFMYWDDNENAGKGGFIKTNEKAPKEKGEQSAAWARLFYEMQKDKDEESGDKKVNQGKYNAIMGSKFLTTEELLDQKIIKSDDPQAKKYGGAYVVRDDKNYQNYKVLYTDKELEDYAKNQVSETPNKWERTDPAGIKDKETDPLGIR